MKTIKIEERTILFRTKWRDWRYQEHIQYRISQSGNVIYCDLSAEDQKRIKIPFKTKLETRKQAELDYYIESKGIRSNDGKRFHEIMNKLGLLKEAK